MRWPLVFYAAALLSCATAPCAGAQGRQQQPWPAVSPAELALQAPQIEAGADAEVLLWSVTITDAPSEFGASVTYQHHLRIKAFTDRGRDSASKVDLPFSPARQVRDISGRTIAPDGSVQELAPADIRERTMIEVDGVKIRAYSFVLPAAVPGSVMEYRWREIRPGQLSHNLVLSFQRAQPVHTVRYLIRPLRVAGREVRTHVFNAGAQPPTVSSEAGYTVIQARNLRAARAEPLMPREMAVGTWMFLYYAGVADVTMSETTFWDNYAKAQGAATVNWLKPHGDLARAAAEATGGTQSPVDKIQALVRFVRQRVRRTDGRVDDPNEHARETLKRGSGTRQDVVVLFTALARAAGLEAYLARMPDREIFVPAPRLRLPYFLTQLVAAVRIGDGWAFVDPANEHAPAGRLRWQQEGTYALVFDGKSPQFLGVGTSPREASSARRAGTLRLLANGDVEGDLSITYSGHFAARYRQQAEELTLAERERLLTERIAASLPRAGIANYRVENLDDPEKPCVIHFTISVPGYAQRAGTRLRFNPALLPREVVPAFASLTRTRPVHFPFAWSEEDDIRVELPEGYEVESTMPARAPVAFKGDVGTHAVTTSVSGRSLTWTRAFAFGGNSVAYPVEEYVPLKVFFDAARAAEAGTLLLRQAGDADGR